MLKDLLLLEEEDMRRCAGAGAVVLGGGGGGSSDGRGGGGGGVWMGGGGGGGGRGRSSVFPVPFSGAGAVSAASSNSAEPSSLGAMALLGCWSAVSLPRDL